MSNDNHDVPPVKPRPPAMGTMEEENTFLHSIGITAIEANALLVLVHQHAHQRAIRGRMGLLCECQFCTMEDKALAAVTRRMFETIPAPERTAEAAEAADKADEHATHEAPPNIN